MGDYGFDGPRRPLVWRILLWPFTVLGSLFGRFSTGDEMQGVTGPLGWLKLIFVSPFVWAGKSLASLLLVWSTSRNFRTFLAGMPAFLFALLIVSLYVFGSINSDRFASVYKKRFLEASQLAKTSDDKALWEHAELYLNRLIRLIPEEREENQVRKAELLMSQKKMGEAAGILQQIVRPTDVGNSRAHLFLGQYYLMGEFRRSRGFDQMSPQEKLRFSIETQNLSEQHLERVLESATTDDLLYPAHAFLFQIMNQRRLYQQAGSHMQFIAERNPMLAASHYEFFTTRLNLPQTADTQAEKNHRILGEAVAKNPDNLQVWQAWIRLFLRQKRFEDALVALRKGVEMATQIQTKMTLQQFQSEVLFDSASNLAETQGEDASRIQRLTLLSEAVRLAPSNRRAVEQLVILGFPLKDGQSDSWLFDAKAGAQPGSPLYYGVNMLLGLRAVFDQRPEEAKQYLKSAENLGPGFGTVLGALTMAIDAEAGKAMLEQQSQASGDANVAELQDKVANSSTLFGIYMILGSRSVLEKQYDRGLDFFEKASAANPNSTTAINNIAYCLINRSGAGTKEYEQALALADRIIQAAPQIPNFLETRGAVYMKMERFADAISDFEQALALGFENRGMIHKNLVIACRAVGRDEEAAAYERMLEQSPAGEESATPSVELQPTQPANGQLETTDGLGQETTEGDAVGSDTDGSDTDGG
jgi:tetratricopeptide (TPR) repeat protein